MKINLVRTNGNKRVYFAYVPVSNQHKIATLTKTISIVKILLFK
jgi:hypothetical protein